MSYESHIFDKIIGLMEAENKRTIVPNPLYMKYNYSGQHEGFPVPGTQHDDFSPIYRRAGGATDADIANYRHLWHDTANFVNEFIELCRGERAQKKCFAYRPISCVTSEQVPGYLSPMEMTYFGPTKYLTCEQVKDYMINFGKGLAALGEKEGNTVCLFLETRWEWMVCSFGIWTQKMVLGTVYANLGEDALSKAFVETECSTIITASSKVPLLIDMMRTGKMQRARLIVVESPPAVGEPASPTSPTAPNVSPEDMKNYEIMDWKDVAALGERSGLPENPSTNCDDLALIMYTSGTTGDPKGVMHSFGSFTAAVKVFYSSVANMLDPQEEDDTYVSSMPLAHVFEFMITTVFMLRGDLVCFGSPRTLSDTFARPHGDHKEFKPCYLIGVPRIYDTIKKAAEAKLPPHGTLERAIYEHAFKTKEKYMREGFDTPFWNEIVFAPLREVTGGRVRSSCGGGGPVSVPTQTFINVVMFRLQQIWGMTETGGAGSKQISGDLDTFCLGSPELGMEMRLQSREGYSITDSPEPRGEICVRGPSLFKGYYKKPELTAEVLDEDGFLHSGDVGALAPRGRFRIVGRVKALAKNSVGEYIPMEALESLYADSPLSLPNGVCVIVHPERNYIGAIVCTDEERVASFLKSTGQGRRAETMQWPFILEDPEFRKEVDKSFMQIGRHARRGAQEIVKRVCLVPHVWTPENGVLTAAGKLKRHEVAARYKETIEFLFKDDL